MSSVYFSTKDSLGVYSNSTINVENHMKKHNQDYKWGSEKHLKNLYPRGKVYDKLQILQFQQYL